MEASVDVRDAVCKTHEANISTKQRENFPANDKAIASTPITDVDLRFKLFLGDVYDDEEKENLSWGIYG